MASCQLLHQQQESTLSVPPGSYIYALCQSGNDALAAISSDNSLRLFDRRTLRMLPDGIFKDIHAGRNGGVTCVYEVTGGHAGGKNIIATSGRDGTIKLWDARGAKRDPIITFATEKSAPVTALTYCPESHTVVAGTELVSSQASINFWDIRSTGAPRLRYVESHNDDVTELQFHPNRKDILLSGSTDGLVNIYNTTIADEDDALLQVVNHGSIHHAGFLGKDAIYALSHDEVFSIHPLTNPDDESEDPVPIQFGDLRPVLQCDYVAQVLSSGGGTYVASGRTSEKRLDLTPLAFSPKFHLDQSDVWRLPGAHGEEVVRSIYLDDQSNSVFTCGEDGYIRVWKLNEEGSEQMQGTAESTQPTTPSTKTHHKKDKKRHKDQRYKPY